MQVVVLGMLVNQLNTFEYPEIHTTYIKAEKNLSIEDKIIKELGEEFIPIAYCESGIRQFDKGGDVILSKTQDKGIFQINQVHWENAERLGIDIDTIDGNIEYAKYLKSKNGTNDWYMSRHCWDDIAFSG